MKPIIISIVVPAVVGVIAFLNSVRPSIPVNSSPGGLLEQAVDARVEPGWLFVTLPDGSEHPFIALDDLNVEHYHPVEIRNGSIFLLRRMSDVNSSDWTDSLWMVDGSKNLTELYSGQGFDFRVSHDGQWVGVSPGYNQIASVVFVNIETRRATRHSFSAFAPPLNTVATYELDGWDNRSQLWFHTVWKQEPYYIVMSPTTRAVQHHSPPSNLPLSARDHALNVNRSILVYSTYPNILDTESAMEFAEDQTVVKLFAHRFTDGRTVQLATSRGGRFDPQWIDDRRISFTEPSTEEQATVEVFPNDP